MQVELRRERGFIILFGTRTQFTNESGLPVQSQCPHCRRVTSFVGASAQKYFTLFFVPLIPMGSAQRVVECTVCRKRFGMSLDQLRSGRGQTAAPAAPAIAGPNPSYAPNAYVQNSSYIQTPANGFARTSGLAIASLVLGILALFCLGPLTAVPGIICGILALVAIKRSEGSLKGFGLGLAGLITSVVGCIIVIIGVLLLMPAISRAREVANRTVDATSMAAIANGCNMYAVENSNHLPPNLLSVAPYLPSPKVLKSKVSSTPEIPTMPTTLSDLEAHCDWVYVGADLDRSFSSSGSVIVLYSKDVYAGHGRNVVFLDGHFAWVNAGDLARIFGESNRERSRMSLPAVVLDGPPPVPALPRVVMVPRAGAVGPGPEATVAPVPSPVVPVAYQGGEALEDLRSSDVMRQRRALNFLQSKRPAEFAAPLPHDIAVALASVLDNADLRMQALRCLRVWVIQENVPVLLKIINDGNSADLHQAGIIAAAIEAIGATHDATAAAAVARHLPHSFTRGAVFRALVDMGPEAESAVWPYLVDPDMNSARTACDVLGKIGTEKSVPELEKALASTKTVVKQRAQMAIDNINARKKK